MKTSVPSIPWVKRIAYALPALEIVDSRIADWDIRITDTIADNGSAGLFVVGSQPVSLADVSLPQIDMTMTRNGEVVFSSVLNDRMKHLPGYPW